MTVTGLPYPLEHPLLGPATWSRLAEPDDHAAGALVAGLGAGGALAWLTRQALDDDGQVRAVVPPPLPAPVGWNGSQAQWAQAWSRAAARWAPRLAGLDIRREVDALARLGGTLIVPGSPQWPASLDTLECPPMCLWARGDADLLRRCQGAAACVPSVSVVGARAATPYGERTAEGLCRELSAADVMVVSGGAYGIDAAAHRGALATGATVSVSAGGVDRFYPAGNARLLQAVVADGLLVAEVPPGCQPARHRFLSRNRVIAALTAATVVVEAAWRSGALSTARHARDLGRGVGAVPGPVTSPQSAGCHRLLREGAVCVTDADEVRELIGPIGSVDAYSEHVRQAAGTQTRLLDGLDGEQSVVLDAMPARRATTTAALARAAGLSEQAVTASLGLLELTGRVQREGGRWRRRR